MTPTYNQYFETTIKKAKNELNNPRLSFNSGYHDKQIEVNHSWPERDMSTHFDPYYVAGYLTRKTEIETGINYSGDSSLAWQKWFYGLSQKDKDITTRSIWESLIIGREYLFTKKHPRNDFTSQDWKRLEERLSTYLS
jgi:hypothetical protein